VNKIHKVFGLGLSRTGTKSLTSALNMLGFKISHYPSDARTYEELKAANYNFTILRTVDGITDLTVAPFYPKLDQLFPQSKFILTVRDPDHWLRSLKQHWDYAENSQKVAADPTAWTTTIEITKLLKTTVFGRYDFDDVHMLKVYKKHCEDVLTYFRDQPQNLLVINICAGEGWEKLCPFLGCTILDQPFPYIQLDSQL
jgi:hypothetical protein